MINFGFDDYETTPLCYAAFHGQLETLSQMLSNVTDINENDQRGKNALYYAITRHHGNAAIALLKAGAKVEEVRGSHFLVQAAAQGNQQLLELLLERFPHLDKMDSGGDGRTGWTPLTSAVQENHKSIVRFLVKKGASLQTLGPDGLLPLQVAARQTDLEMLELLWSLGAEVNAVDLQGNSTLRFIRDYQDVRMDEENRRKVIEFLKQKGGKTIPPLSLWQRLFRRG